MMMLLLLPLPLAHRAFSQPPVSCCVVDGGVCQHADVICLHVCVLIRPRARPRRDAGALVVQASPKR
jgi:hypothetical protein